MSNEELNYLASKLKNGYVYDERYCNELLKLIYEKAGRNFAAIVQTIIEALQEQKNCDIIVT